MLQWNNPQYQQANVNGAFRDVENGLDKSLLEHQYNGAYVSPQEYYSNKQLDQITDMFRDSMTANDNRIRELEDKLYKSQESHLSMMEGFMNNHNQLMELLNSKYPTSYQTDTSNTSDLTSNGSATFKSEYQQTMYNDLIKYGYSNNQAIALMMQVAAEGGWQDKHTFVKRTTNKIYDANDPSKNIAIGMINWQGGREVALYKELGEKGLLNSDGTLKQSKETMSVMTKYMHDEIQSGKWDMKEFLAGKNRDPYELARLANLNYTLSKQSDNVLAGRERNYRNFYNTITFNESPNSSIIRPKGQSTAKAYLAKDNKEYIGQFYDPTTMNFGIDGFGSILLNPSKNKITSGYGARNAPIDAQGNKGSSHHAGYDISAVVGTKLTSPFAEGKVINVGWDKGGGGNVISIKDSKTGNVVQLMHMDKINVKFGQTVRAGDFIGTSGNSGTSTGAHIDLRVYNQWGEYLTFKGETAAKTGNLSYVNKRYLRGYK